MMLLRIRKLPEEVLRTSTTAHHELDLSHDGAHAVKLPLVHLGQNVWLLVPQIKILSGTLYW